MEFDDLKHAQRERLVFLDQCLTWRGVAKRKDLMERFGVSSAQAALDFKLYLGRAHQTPPIYDAARKCYVAAEDHVALAPSGLEGAFETLQQTESESRFASLPKLERLADRRIVTRLYQAISANELIHVKYTSIKTGADSGRWIAPIRFASDGERVHLRAYSFKHNAYRDFIPIRISADSSFKTKKPSEDLPEDEDWNTIVRIYLKPKSSLSREQAEVVRREYGFSGSSFYVETRKALEFYASRKWGLDRPEARLERDRVEYLPKGAD